MPNDFADATFSIGRGDGGVGTVYAPLGSVGGARTTPVFYVELPTITAEEQLEVVEVSMPAMTSTAEWTREIPQTAPITVTITPEPLIEALAKETEVVVPA